MLDLWLGDKLLSNVTELDAPIMSGDFSLFLNAIVNVVRPNHPDLTELKYFQYVDEEGDPIDVKSDEEFSAFLEMYGMKRSSEITAGEKLQIVIPTKTSWSGSSMSGSSVDLITSEEESDIEDLLMTPSSSATVPTDLSFLNVSEGISSEDIRFLEVLGNGVSGMVYKAIRISTDELIAVKCISLDIDADIQSKILSELNILHKCCCPFVIGFFGAFFMDNQISICTEYMDGGSLDGYGRISEEILGCVSVAIVEGLTYLWRQKIMHRDFKPSNILVNSKGEVKLCDFGVSVQLISSIAKSYVGTNAYMAPERILGSEYGVYSEVWSLGISLLEMAIGHFPYDHASPVDLMQKIVNEVPEELNADEFGVEFRDFIHLCLRKEPSARPSPERLLDQPFIKKYSAVDRCQIISNWLHQRSDDA